jgi:hypothetical protein
VVEIVCSGKTGWVSELEIQRMAKEAVEGVLLADWKEHGVVRVGGVLFAMAVVPLQDPERQADRVQKQVVRESLVKSFGSS